MHDVCTYHVEVKGEVDVVALNAASPITAQALQIGTVTTHLIIHSDQSGLIGLMRYLHQQGFVLLSVTSERQNIVREIRNEDSYKR